MAPSQPSLDQLIEQARGGCEKSTGELFDQCRRYLRLIAHRQVDNMLHAKLGSSDLVQQTLMHAHRDFVGFRGRSEGELFAWLQRILANEVARSKRDYLDTAKRDVSREVALGRPNDSGSGGSWLPVDIESPSRHAMAREDHTRLHRALERLSEPHRRIIELRNRDQMTFAEIGRNMSLSEESSRRLWSRAVECLRQELVAGNGS